jgi:hypothetical protein
MGKQYQFLVEDGIDRHRWITFYNDNRLFVEEYFDIIEQVDLVDRNSHRFWAYFSPQSYVRNNVFFCQLRISD